MKKQAEELIRKANQMREEAERKRKEVNAKRKAADERKRKEANKTPNKTPNNLVAKKNKLYKQSCRVKQIHKFTCMPDGRRCGKQLLGNGPLGAVDGVQLNKNDRILITEEGVHNGIYTLTNLNPFILTRAPDSNGGSSFTNITTDTCVTIREGHQNAHKHFAAVAKENIILGVTSFQWVKIQ